jgi:hypothetical protein
MNMFLICFVLYACTRSLTAEESTGTVAPVPHPTRVATWHSTAPGPGRGVAIPQMVPATATLAVN